MFEFTVVSLAGIFIAIAVYGSRVIYGKGVSKDDAIIDMKSQGPNYAKYKEKENENN